MAEQLQSLAELDTCKGADAGFECQINHPTTGAPIALWITVLGTDSETYRRTLNAQTRRMQERARKTRRPSTPEEIDEDALQLLAAVTTGWRAELELDKGVPFPAFSKAAAVDLYRRFRWIREQVDQAVGDRANFLPR